MLKLVGTHKDGTVADEKELISDDGKPTRFLIGLAVVEIACDIALACLIAKALVKIRR